MLPVVHSRSATRRRTLGALALLIGCAHPPEARFADASPVESRALTVVERQCAAPTCHGLTPTAASTARVDEDRWLTFRISAEGDLLNPDAALLSMRKKVEAEGDVELSTLLRKTLPLAHGGLPHARGPIFDAREAPGHRALADWAASVDGLEGANDPPLDAREQLFADSVYPHLIQRGCATGTCHGPLNFGVTGFRPPAIPGTLSISRSDLRATYHEARNSLTLWGDPMRARLISKMLPFEAGGMPHKGGNDVFLGATIERDQPAAEAEPIRAIRAWQAAERAFALGLVGVAADTPTSARAILFIGGPLAPSGPFETPAFTPGTDLYRLDPPFRGVTPVNLTAGIHDMPADIRDPAVDHAGRRVVFTMRRSPRDAANLYVMSLDAPGPEGLVQVTHDASGDVATVHRAPVFGPNGGAGPTGEGESGERLYFASNVAHEPSDAAQVENIDLYAVDPDGRRLERLTQTPVPEVEPTFLVSGEFAGTMAYTIKRSIEGGYKGVVFRFPIDHNAKYHLQPEAHPHFGMSEPPQVFHRLREMPDGRAAMVLLDERNVWRGGQLAVLERQFAVEVDVADEASVTLPGFRHALTILSPQREGTPPATMLREGLSPGGFVRDVAPLPDGTLMAAHLPGPFDLADPTVAPSPGLVQFVLADDRATQRPQVVETVTLFDRPELPVSTPVGVFARPLEDDPHPRAFSADRALATVIHSGVPTIEALLALLPPIAARTLRTDLKTMRAVSPLSSAPGADAAFLRTPIPPDETRDGMTGATRASLSGHMPLFIAGEAPVAPDGSLGLHVPPHEAVRFVTVDDTPMATGAQHHQWYAMQPGERFPVGIPAAAFPARCAGCHGAMEGRPEAVFRPATDVVTQASVTEAMYVGADRRQPQALPTLGRETAIFVDFRRDVAPILETKCVGCHGGSNPAGDVSLTSAPTLHYTDAYESLLTPGTGSAGGFAFVDALGHRARASALAERLLGRELDAPAPLTGTCPPGGPRLAKEELATILRWIELGAAFVGAP